MFLDKDLPNVSRVVFVLALTWLLFYPIAAQSETRGIDDVYLAKDDGSGQAGEIVTEFTTTDIPIFCVVTLDTIAKVTVKMNFVAVSVPGVRADTKVVSASFTTKEGQNRVNFTGRPDSKWTAGKYRVDIFLDGKLARNVEFAIKKAGIDGPAAAKYIQPLPRKPKPPVYRKN